ncbi:SH3 domain-containing protein [Alteromonas sp. ASW11-19]|uniref:SH3 domain-containing protein n=1 Tax=Alteromonas salexigens TaxID=2982530 RepID=A0ABT2VW44_9ALTE|nr:SH3 domain-containing protein [Alteromonas salexigens]MCU7556064.1 SH3 domain-containing protein [Alteromonas salexigens]
MKLILACLLILLSATALAAPVSVTVVEPYADVHTGPASEYPVFHAIEKGERISVLAAHTGWYKIETARGIQGWVSASELSRTIVSQDNTFVIAEADFDSFQERRFEVTVSAGRLENTNALSVSAAWMMTANIAAEAGVSQALGDFSENRLWLVRLQHTPFPDWRVSPYWSLGAGQIQTTPTATLVQSGAESRTNDLLEVGIGARLYLVKQFSMRLEYRRLTALTERDDLEELNHWQLGFSVFF